MTKQDIITYANTLNDGEEVIFSAWQKVDFDNSMTDDEWVDFVDLIDSRMDWSYTHEQMSDMKDIG